MILSISSLVKKAGSFSLYIDQMRINTPAIYGLIGPNGCGKSTLAKLICGILKPDSGKIEISYNSREITMVTQKPYIMDDTVFNNLEYPLKVRKIKNGRQLCEENLKKIGFIDKKNQKARGLSGGEKQKLAMLRAMIFNPRLIILDETMADMDLDSLDLFETMILERQKENPIVWIIISHQLAMIRRLCDYVYFMYDGYIEAEGRTEELLVSSNPKVRRFLKHEVIENNNETINSRYN